MRRRSNCFTANDTYIIYSRFRLCGRSFYTAEYTKAFPVFDNYKGYSYRIFNRLFRLIGLCETGDGRDSKNDEWGPLIRKTDILEMLFSFVEPK